MSLSLAVAQLDTIIRKARVHLYKPIQIAEILYRERTENDIDLADLESYRSQSRRWRDKVSIMLVGRASTSSARFQDNLFDANALPPELIEILGQRNRETGGAVESYIYNAFRERYSQMSAGLAIAQSADPETFQITEFINSFRRDPGLSRSVDKIFEIIVYALFSSILDCLDIQLTLRINNTRDKLLEEFSDFTEKILGLSAENPEVVKKPHVYRVGVTNAADRGLDMWANFGLAIQIKHMSLTADLAGQIMTGISADRIVIVCKDVERDTLISVINQFGGAGRIQSVITEDELSSWYDRALRGAASDEACPHGYGAPG